MTTVALSYHRIQRVQKNVKSKIDSVSLPSLNWKAICIAGFLVSLALLVFYAWQINNLTRGFYSINSYEKQISKLSEANKNLEVSFAESSFLGQALVKIQAMNFQKTTSVKYIKILDNSVATAKTENVR